MNLQDYIERMKMWIDKQHFIMRHYKFALGIFFIITVALLGIGIFYPHEEENVYISLDQSNGRDANQIERGSEKLSKETTHDNRNGKGKNYFKDESDIKNVKDRVVKSNVHGRLLYDITGVERANPWREVFKDIPIDELLGQNKITKDSNGNFVDINNDLHESDDSMNTFEKKVDESRRNEKYQQIRNNKKHRFPHAAWHVAPRTRQQTYRLCVCFERHRGCVRCCAWWLCCPYPPIPLAYLWAVLLP